MKTHHPVIAEAARLLEAARARRVRTHCLTNSVVQKFTADGLSALGAHPSMTASLEEVADFARRADALLVNLGTLDAARQTAIHHALDAIKGSGKPWTLDPVHCDLSPVRLAFARELMQRGPAVVRGNAQEVAVLGPAPPGTILIRTGPADLLQRDGERIVIHNGHPLMARVTGTGCLSGAMIATFLALGEDRLTAAAAALAFYGVCAEIAAESARGPGTFAASLMDAIANMEPGEMLARGKVDHEPA